MLLLLLLLCRAFCVASELMITSSKLDVAASSCCHSIKQSFMQGASWSVQQHMPAPPPQAGQLAHDSAVHNTQAECPACTTCCAQHPGSDIHSSGLLNE
jgi:hypothetical protein